TLKKPYNIYLLYDTNIYLYNKLNIESSTRTFIYKDKLKYSEKMFQKSISNKFSSIRDWNTKNLNLLKIESKNEKFHIKDKVTWVRLLANNLNLKSQSIIIAHLPKFLEFAKYEKKIKLMELYRDFLENRISLTDKHNL
ncbi:unnamed protein product, partial [marine sediment metagenome]